MESRYHKSTSGSVLNGPNSCAERVDYVALWDLTPHGNHGETWKLLVVRGSAATAGASAIGGRMEDGKASKTRQFRKEMKLQQMLKTGEVRGFSQWQRLIWIIYHIQQHSLIATTNRSLIMNSCCVVGLLCSMKAYEDQAVENPLRRKVNSPLKSLSIPFCIAWALSQHTELFHLVKATSW